MITNTSPLSFSSVYAVDADIHNRADPKQFPVVQPWLTASHSPTAQHIEQALDSYYASYFDLDYTNPALLEQENHIAPYLYLLYHPNAAQCLDAFGDKHLLARLLNLSLAEMIKDSPHLLSDTIESCLGIIQHCLSDYRETFGNELSPGQFLSTYYLDTMLKKMAALQPGFIYCSPLPYMQASFSYNPTGFLTEGIDHLTKAACDALSGQPVGHRVLLPIVINRLNGSSGDDLANGHIIGCVIEKNHNGYLCEIFDSAADDIDEEVKDFLCGLLLKADEENPGNVDIQWRFVGGRKQSHNDCGFHTYHFFKFALEKNNTLDQTRNYLDFIDHVHQIRDDAIITDWQASQLYRILFFLDFIQIDNIQ
ncbi:hypothetical protein [Martelella alba]|uniref:Ubiquitin-like protease family profile domain-containing protein n=1 Tax=Martelella alba TaxID=2590451 RepID=A0ABY2SKB0_9HYPH|nr:hypothetical protein [Martelella alba]TKI05972.1 hypothetical protein FCN80_12215 [Martelella alba]